MNVKSIARVKIIQCSKPSSLISMDSSSIPRHLNTSPGKIFIVNMDLNFHLTNGARSSAYMESQPSTRQNILRNSYHPRREPRDSWILFPCAPVILLKADH